MLLIEIVSPKTEGRFLSSPPEVKVTLLFRASAAESSEVKLKVLKNTLLPQKWPLGHNSSIKNLKY